jgi:hypothetical protein
MPALFVWQFIYNIRYAATQNNISTRYSSAVWMLFSKSRDFISTRFMNPRRTWRQFALLCKTTALIRDRGAASRLCTSRARQKLSSHVCSRKISRHDEFRILGEAVASRLWFRENKQTSFGLGNHSNPVCSLSDHHSRHYAPNAKEHVLATDVLTVC